LRKIGNGKKKWISVLVLATAVFAMAATSAYGASAIDLNAKATITLKQQMDSSELSAKTYEIPVYKVADVDVTGKYTLTKDFHTDALAGIESVTSETASSEWDAFAQAAKEAVAAAAKTSAIEPAITLTVSEGTASANDIAVGLYLADVPTITTDDYEYVASPLLIAVPGNNYTATGNDDWSYDVSNELKFARNDRYGDLVINKSIDTFNGALGNVSFVFKVTAVKDYAYTDVTTDPKTVYSNVISVDFSAAGTQSVTIEDIPAGAEVTVTEVYSGANYTAAGTAAASTAIVADETVTVSFTNTYDNTLISGGSAVVNNFSYDDGWTWTEYIDDEAVTSSATE
jgi:hypothetical protein